MGSIAVPILSHYRTSTSFDSDRKMQLTRVSLTIAFISGNLNALHCILGIIFSVITLVYVYVKKREPGSTTTVPSRVCGTILLMNIVYMLYVLGYIGGVTGINMHFFVHNLLPFLTSAWNPIVLFARAQAVRQTFISLMTRVCTTKNGNVPVHA